MNRVIEIGNRIVACTTGGMRANGGGQVAYEETLLVIRAEAGGGGQSVSKRTGLVAIEMESG
jgi:hypothetical protein